MTIHKRGFVGLIALIAIVLGLIVIGGGAYYVTHKNSISSPQTQVTVGTQKTTENAIQNGGTIPEPPFPTITRTDSSNAWVPVMQASVVQMFGETLPVIPAGGENTPIYLLAGGNILYAPSSTISYNSPSVELPGADIATFEVMGTSTSGYARDKNHVYYYGQIITACADTACTQMVPIDSETLTPIPADEMYDSFGYTRDKNHVYAVSRYSHLGSNSWASRFTVLENADLSTFTSPSGDTLAPIYGKDKNSVWYGDQVIVGADPATFVGIDFTSTGIGDYGKDAAHVYYKGKILPGADPATFVTHGHPYPPYTFDASHVYYNGELMPADRSTFKFDGNNASGGYSHDATHVFLDATIIPNANPATFSFPQFSENG